jgi:4-hydroxybenzoate polyprenyltransferase
MAAVGDLEQKILDIAEFSRIEHTLFALPFAFMGVVLAAGDVPDPVLVLWVFVGLIGGRGASLMINDYVDAPLDAENPRTADRPIPSGRIGKREGLAYIAVGALVLFVSAWQINLTAFVLSPIILVNAYVYPHVKRYSAASHLVLGLNGSYAPIGGWIAVRAQDAMPYAYLTSLEYWPAVILGAALVFWYAGFDVIYSLQDLEVDREMGLKSLPAVYGVGTARRLAAASHGVMLALLGALTWWAGTVGFDARLLGAGVLVGALLLGYEHLIAERDTDKAFFYVNAVVSAVLFVAVLAAVLLA